MKRTRLIVLLIVVAGLLIFRVQLGDAALAARVWWKDYQAARDDRELRQHEAALAALVEQRGDAHADVVAAELYWSASQGFQLLQHSHDVSTPSPAVEQAWLDRADAAFARALKANDLWAWWLATDVCPARPKTCRSDIALDRLKQLDGDNGAVWMIEMDQAAQVHDPQRQRAALARLALSSRFDSHFGDAMRGMLSAFALKPLPGRLRGAYAGDVSATPEQTTIMLAGALGANTSWMRGLGYKALLDTCRTRDPAADAERAADCRATGTLLANGDRTLLEEMFGNLLLLRAAGPDELAQTRQRIRDTRWRETQYMRFDPERSADDAQRWRAAWMAGGSEVLVIERLLHARGVALQAPTDFRVEERLLDPAH